jgi:hypothetical protein
VVVVVVVEGSAIVWLRIDGLISTGDPNAPILPFCDSVFSRRVVALVSRDLPLSLSISR